MRKMVYLASPLFSETERSTNEAICRVVEKWCDVFLPQRDGYLVADLISNGMTPQTAYAVVFRNDMQAIERSDVVIINLDGRSVDEGAAFELGFAHARAKLCVGYRTDVRVLLEWGLNPMIVAPLANTFRTLDELEMWIAKYAQTGESDLVLAWSASGTDRIPSRRPG
jgi:nucleoside 2-deoxyribosyltransferase